MVKAIYTAVSPAQTSSLVCLPSLQRPRWDVCEAQTDFLTFTSRDLLLISADPSVTEPLVAQAGPSGVIPGTPLSDPTSSLPRCPVCFTLNTDPGSDSPP